MYSQLAKPRFRRVLSQKFTDGWLECIKVRDTTINNRRWGFLPIKAPNKRGLYEGRHPRYEQRQTVSEELHRLVWERYCVHRRWREVRDHRCDNRVKRQLIKAMAVKNADICVACHRAHNRIPTAPLRWCLLLYSDAFTVCAAVSVDMSMT